MSPICVGWDRCWPFCQLIHLINRCCVRENPVLDSDIGGLTHHWQSKQLQTVWYGTVWYRWYGMVWYDTGTVQMQERGGAGGAQPPPELSNSYFCCSSLQRPGCHLRNGWTEAVGCRGSAAPHKLLSLHWVQLQCRLQRRLRPILVIRRITTTCFYNTRR